MTYLENVRNYVTDKHSNQTYDDQPYVVHLENVVTVIKRYTNDENLIVAAYLHDILEDTATSYSDIKKQFGYVVAEIVFAVTDELGRNRKDRHEKTYPKIKGSVGAMAVKLADRIANVQYGIKTKSLMVLMYEKEHQDFYYNLHQNYYNFIDQMWNELDLTIASIKDIDRSTLK